MNQENTIRTKALETDGCSFAIQSWVNLLGTAGVAQTSDILQAYARTCGVQGHQPIAILSPLSTSDVQQIVKIAQQYRVPVYPVSRGRNSGYGSASPSSPGCAIIDLRFMNSILEVNEELAYAIVEPGVTQAQMQEYLERTGSRLWIDVTGAAPDSSLVGNILERGYGLSPYSDRFQNSCGMEVVLPSGELLHTGFGHIPNAKSTHLFKWGIGPYLDGIFTQSNFGVVTKIGVWLMPKPETAEIVSITFNDDEALLNSIEKLRELKLRGLFPSAVHIANDLRVISVFQQYPFDEMQGVTPLSDEMLERLKKSWQVGAWNCIAGMWGAKSQIKSMKYELCRALKGIVRPHFISRSLFKFVSQRRWLHWLPGARNLISKTGLLKLLEGVPSWAPQNGGYWRKRAGLPTGEPNLERDKCGIIWVSPIVPSTRKDLSAFISVTRSVCKAHTFETNVTVSLLSERAACCTVAIIFDRADSVELRKATLCQEVLLTEYLKHGFPPYRAGSDWGSLINAVLQPSDSFVTLCSTVMPQRKVEVMVPFLSW